jgi:hypothetical protein
MDKKKIAEIMFEGERAKIALEDSLFDIGVPFEELGFDDYDCSLELFDVDDEYRLSVEAQKLIYDAGFIKVYMNHKNKWETHYTFLSAPFKEVEGWRVSYPSKRGKEEKGIWVEKIVDGWPKDWLETGYVIVKS